MKSDRQARLKQLFIEEKQLSCHDICERFNISVETVRRDLSALEKEGAIRRVYGGAILNDNTFAPNPIQPYAARSKYNNTEKNKIAEELIRHIEDNTTLALDSGTTILALARLLSRRKNLNIITNDVHIAEELSEHTNHKIYMIGGLLRRDDLITGGFIAQEFLENFSRIDVAVIAADGFTDGLADYNVDMGALKKNMIRKARKVYAALDHTKFSVEALYKVCGPRDLDVLVTGKEAPAESVAALRSAGVEVILVS